MKHCYPFYTTTTKNQAYGMWKRRQKGERKLNEGIGEEMVRGAV